MHKISGIFSEDAAEGVGNFAEGGVGFHGCNEVRHEILALPGGALHCIKRIVGAAGVALRAQVLHARNLARFEFRIDAERFWRDKFLRYELVHAYDDRLFRFHFFLELVRRLCAMRS